MRDPNKVLPLNATKERLCFPPCHESQRDADWERVKTLVEFIAWEAECPCCTETEKCTEGCTMEQDAPEGWERIQAVREVLAQLEEKKP